MDSIEDAIYMGLALAEARRFEGATAPNPPVGALVVKNRKILAVGAHQKAGMPHGEINALNTAVALHGHQAVQGSSIYVTLEPCNHQGRTGPCTQALIAAGVAEVVIGTKDPNPKVAGGGAQCLLDAGIQVRGGVLEDQCRSLIAPFEKQSRTGIPYIAHKLAWRIDSNGQPTMIPEPGSKTFTSASSLQKAHEWRRQSDAIITGMATVLADDPYFTVRHVKDHDHKKRILAVVGDGRDSNLSAQWEAWRQRQESLGFVVCVYDNLLNAVSDLGRQGVLQALLEAGPKLSLLAEKTKVWDKRLTIVSRAGQPDLVFEEHRSSISRCSLES